MVQVIQAQNVTLADLKEEFGLQKSANEEFFTEWCDNLPEISHLEKQALDRVKANYLSLVETAPLLEDAVKLVVLAPLLDWAGFFHPPFYIATEESIEIREKVLTKDAQATQEIIKGKIDVLVLQEQFWLLVVESKRVSFSLYKAISQALTYLLANPTAQPVYSLVLNGEDFQFIKLIKQDKPFYALSDKFTLYKRGNELYTVLSILKKLGQILIL